MLQIRRGQQFSQRPPCESRAEQCRWHCGMEWMGLTSSGQASGLWRLQPAEGNLDRSIDSMPDLHEGARPAKNIPNNYKFERAQKRPAGVVAERGGGALARRRLLTAHRRAVLIRPSLPHSRNRKKSQLSSHVPRHNEKPFQIIINSSARRNALLEWSLSGAVELLRDDDC